MEQHQEAIQLFAKVVQELTSGNKDLKVCLRLCQHACELLNWSQNKDWFQRELEGYPTDIARPTYRHITGLVKWEPKGSLYDRVKWQTSSYFTQESAVNEQLPALDIFANIEWISGAAKSGYEEKTGNEKSVVIDRRTVTLSETRHFPASYFSNVIHTIENYTYDFASRSYVQLKYGEALNDIWSDYRSKVDGLLRSINMANHISAIEEGIKSKNPEALRNSVFGCRNLLNDLANYLWQDSRPTYDLLSGKGPGSKLDVTQSNFSNRLTAYLHQKGISGTRGKSIRDQIEYLTSWIRSLIALQSEAHQPISDDDAKFIALSTYFIIGEISIKTDLIPITDYKKAELLE